MTPWVQKVALGAYEAAHALKLSHWPFFERWFPPLYFAYKKHLEDPFERLLRACPDLLVGGHVLDIGANIGYTSELFSHFLSAGFQVFAFEPETVNFRALERMIQRKGLANKVRAVHAAVGAVDGTVALSLNPVHPADHRVLTTTLRQNSSQRSQQEIAMTSLDHFTSSLTLPKVSFIKVDVQGYEEPVCEGMTEVLIKNPEAVVALEYDPGGMEQLGFKPTGILDFFDRRSYRRYLLTRRNGLQEIARPDLLALTQKKGYIDLVFSLRKLL